MTEPTNPPVAFGATVYEARAWSYGDHEVPCPVCYGNLCVVIELGSGERITVECDACGLGYDGPRGVVNEPCAGSEVCSLKTGGLVFEGNGWWILNDYRKLHWGVDVFATREEAEVRREILFADAEREAVNRGESIAAHKRKSLTWKVRYYRDCLRKAERDVAWYGTKLSDGLARKRKPAPGFVNGLEDVV